MCQEQVGQKVRVLGVVLGAAGDKGLAIFLERDGIDGVEGDPVIAFEERDEVDRGLFQTQTDAGLGMLLAQFQQPFPQRFGRGVNDDGPALGGAGGDGTSAAGSGATSVAGGGTGGRPTFLFAKIPGRDSPANKSPPAIRSRSVAQVRLGKGVSWG